MSDDLTSAYAAYREGEIARDERAAGNRALAAMGVNMSPDEVDPTGEAAAAKMDRAKGADTSFEGGERDPLAGARGGVMLTPPREDAKGLKPRAPKGKPITEQPGTYERALAATVKSLTGSTVEEWSEGLQAQAEGRDDGTMQQRMIQALDVPTNVATDTFHRALLQQGMDPEMAAQSAMIGGLAVGMIVDPTNAVGAGRKAVMLTAAAARGKAAVALGEAAARGEGITFDLATGAYKGAKGKTAVSMAKGGHVFDHKPSTEELHTWLMSLKVDPEKVGLWENNGKWYADVTKVVDTDAAEAMGKAERQRAVFDFDETGGGSERMLKYAPTEEGPPMRLEHYSNRPVEGDIDPQRFGTGQAGRERGRLTEPGFQPRSYYYEEGATPEARFAKAPNKYTVEVGENRIYDINADPEGLMKGEGGLTEAEARIRAAGYAGYRNTSENAQPQRAVAMFEARTPLQVGTDAPSSGTKVYHGARQAYTKVDLEKSPEGLWVGEDPTTANVFTGRYSRAVKAGSAPTVPNVRPYVLLPDAKMATRDQWVEMMENVGLDPAKVREAMQAQGWDGVTFPPDTVAGPTGTLRNAGEPGTRHLIFNLSKLIEPFTGQTAAVALTAGAGAAAGAALGDDESSPYAGAAVGGMLLRRGRGNLPLLKSVTDFTGLAKGSKVLTAVSAEGASMLFHAPPGTGAKGFKAAMVAEFGESIIPHLDALYPRSRKLLEEYLAPLKGQMTTFKDAMAPWHAAEGRPNWYGARQQLVKVFGPDADLMSGLVAAASPGMNVTDNIEAAIDAYRIIKTAPRSEWKALLEASTAIRSGHGASGKIPNILRAVDGQPLQGNKVSDFHVALLGGEDVFTTDRHVIRIAFNKLDDATLENLVNGIDDPLYALVSQWGKKFAERVGTTPAYAQQRLWVGHRMLQEFGEGLEKSNNPVWPTLIERAEQAGVLDLVPKMGRLGDEEGRVRAGVLYGLGRAAVGALAGGSFGEDFQERVQNALLGAGLGTVTPPTVKKIATLIRNNAPGLRHPLRHGKPLSQYPPAVVAEMDRLFASYDEALDEARRGVRPHAQALSEAETLIRSGRMELEEVKAFFPGTALNDSEAMAVVKMVHDEGVEIQALAKQMVATGATDPTELLNRLFVMREVLPKQAGVVAEAGRTLSAMNDPTSAWNLYLKQWQDLFADPSSGMTPDRLAHIISKFDSPLKLGKVAAALNQPGWADVVIEGLYGIMLSNPVTPTVNTLMTGLATILAPIERMGAAVAGETAHWLEPFAMVYGMAHGLPKAFKYAAHAALTGEQILEGGRKVETAFNASMTPQNLGRLLHSNIAGRVADATIGAIAGAQAGGSVGYVYGDTEGAQVGGAAGAVAGALVGGGRIARAGGRALLTSDELFRTVLWEGEKYAQAVRKGFAESNLARRKRVIHETLANPSFAVRKQAQALADEFTFNAPPGPLLSGFIEGSSQLPGPYKIVAKVVAPFLVVPTNLFKFASKRTPGLQQLHASWLADMATPGIRQDTAMAQLALGGAFMAAVGMHAADGGFVGSGPADPNLKREWLADGNQEYAAVFGDTSFSLNQADPYGMMAGMIADWAAISAHVDDATNEQIAAAMLMVPSKSMLSKTYLEGAQDFLEAITNKDPNKAYRFLHEKSATPVPGLVKQARRISDPHLREARTLIDAAMNKVPGFSKDLPYMRNIFAQPIPTHEPVGYGLDWINPFKMKKVKKDAAVRAILDNKISVSMPGWYIYGDATRNFTLDPQKVSVGVELTPHQRDELIQLIGKPLHAEWSAYVKSNDYQQDTPAMRELVFHRYHTKFRNAGVADLVDKHPDLAAKWETILEKRANALGGK